MKISFSWLKDYLPFELAPERTGEILTDIGLEVEGLERVEAVKGGLEGLVVGEVISCEKHPDADRLKLTQVNIGSETLSIVCGAPNVAEGQKVIVATVGAQLYPNEGDPFKIKKGKIRGEVSMGMICAEDEIGLGKGHDGIMVIDADAKVGTAAATYFRLESDPVFEIGLTPNRADAISHIGVARDLRVAFHNMHDLPERQDPALTWPSIGAFSPDSAVINLPIEVESISGSPAYCGLVLEGLTVAPSPEWLRRRLESIGCASINNVVDITNYVLHETGQPLHAFDKATIQDKVIVKELPEGTKFTTLDDQERTLSDQDLMICDSKGGMCIAGVFGGKHSGVSDKTTSIFLESAYFNPVQVRKSAKRHGLNTDASYRFERGVDPNITEYALKRAALLIQEICGGSYSELTRVGAERFPNFEFNFSPEKARKLIGHDIPDDAMKAILNDLEIGIIEQLDFWKLSVPPYRVDVQREADIVEEILRIYGFNQVGSPAITRTALSFQKQPDPERMRNKIADQLSARGFYEMMSNSLTKASYMKINKSEDTSVHILNPLSNDLGVMRTTLLFDGLEAVNRNQNHKWPNLKMYEFGSVYERSEKGYKETAYLALYLTGKATQGSWISEDRIFDPFDMKREVITLLDSLGLLNKSQSNQVDHELFDQAIEINIAKNQIGHWGVVSSSVAKQFDIDTPVYTALINWDKLLSTMRMNKVSFKSLPKFPIVKRDLSLLLKKEISFDQIKSSAQKTEKKILRKVSLFDVYEGKNLEAGTKSYAVSFYLRDDEKTLNDKVIDKTMERIQQNLERELGALLR